MDQLDNFKAYYFHVGLTSISVVTPIGVIIIEMGCGEFWVMHQVERNKAWMRARK
jgi:hypothetical protein